MARGAQFHPMLSVKREFQSLKLALGYNGEYCAPRANLRAAPQLISGFSKGKEKGRLEKIKPTFAYWHSSFYTLQRNAIVISIGKVNSIDC